MYDNSTRFQQDLIVRIRRTAKDVGIDPDNYACDLYCVAELGKCAKQTTESSKANSSIIYKPMSDEERIESRKKIGF